MTWTPELSNALQAVLADHGCDTCPECARHLDENDVDWGGGNTEAGTDFYTVEVVCSNCGHELRSGGGWGEPPASTEDMPGLLAESIDR